MKIGYARVSKNDQDTQLQLDALHAAGCERIYQEKQSGAKIDRVELNHCLKSLRAGDTLIVWKLDRLGRSLSHLVTTVAELNSAGVGFRSITENIDTISPTGTLIFHIFCALAEFERGLIRERVLAGLEVAKKKGKKFGRPEALSKEDKMAALAMLNSGDFNKTEIAKHLKVTRPTLYAFLNEVDSITLGEGE